MPSIRRRLSAETGVGPGALSNSGVPPSRAWGDIIGTQGSALISWFAKGLIGAPVQESGDMTKPMNVGAPRPMNTLSGNSTTHRPLLASSPAATNTFSRKELDLTEISPNPPRLQGLMGPSPRKRSIGSASIADSFTSNKSTPSMSVELDHPKQHRRRKRPRRSSKKWSSIRETEREGNKEGDYLAQAKGDGDEADDVHIIMPSGGSMDPQMAKPQESTRPISEIERNFKRRQPHQDPAQRFRNTIDMVDERRMRVEQSPDELAVDDEENMTTRAVKRPRRSPPSNPSKSGSILPKEVKRISGAKLPSTTNDDQAIINERLGKAKLVTGTGLRVRRGASGKCVYQSEHPDDPTNCFLSIREISHTLIPVDQDDNILEPYTYLTLNIKKVLKIFIPEDQKNCFMVSVVLNGVDFVNGVGPRLSIEFEDQYTLTRFMEWVAIFNEQKAVKLEGLPSSKLVERFDELAMRARSNRLLRDADLESTGGGDDIKVMQHNHDNRSRGLLKDTDPTTASPRPWSKLKDNLTSDISGPPKGDPSGESRNDETLVRRRAPTTRLTFAPVRSRDSVESFYSEPERWTSLNPGWENRWRNSLVFPSKGKNRATVDKEDIHRLDEGEYLNDNLIIFYLRYLQKKLEDERPNLAKRVYFHNTFFYDKLKPSKAGKGINYDSVKSWTSKVDLFSKDFIVVPINENTHWYVAIICNAPKLLPGPDDQERVDDIGSEAVSTLCGTTAAQSSGPDSRDSSRASPPRKARVGPDVMDVDSAAQEEVTEVLSCMSIDKPDLTGEETKKKIDNKGTQETGSPPSKRGQDVYLIKDSDRPETDLEGTTTSTLTPQSRKKTGKGQTVASRKIDPDRPRIITLDSFGSPHVLTVAYLKQYLAAELRDKKGVETAATTPLGTTAKDIPEQTNCCDCGVFLLGYIQEFLRDPDVFVPSLLQRDGRIPWGLDPCELRANIRNLIFELQEIQQKDEDMILERKRQARALKARMASEASGHAPTPNEDTSRPDSSDLELCRDGVDESKRLGQPPHLRSSSAATDSSVTERDTRSKQPDSAEEDAKHAIAKPRPYVFTLSEDEDNPKNTRWTKYGNQAGVEQSQRRLDSGLRVTPPPGKIDDTSQQDTRRAMPGTFPGSPPGIESVKAHLLSPTTEDSGSISIQDRFVQPLSSTPSTKSSRGASPSDPVVVEDGDKKRPQPIRGVVKHLRSLPESRFVVEIPSNSGRIQSPRQDSKADHRRRQSNQSPYFASHGSRERVISAKMKEKPKEEVLSAKSKEKLRGHIIDVSDG
ncbi:hypothetical protein GGS20DRAFT_393776 [Poronia punctata]|nr:hypothetical protein GGS20DRAFT_393776 [Poronia punctata]